MSSPPLVVDVDAAEGPTGPGMPASDFDEVSTYYPDMISWWNGWLHKLIERRPGTANAWCPQWWRHPEAIAVLEALWRAWEGARADEDNPDAMLSWWERFYGILPVLMDRETSPFGDCQRERHSGDIASRQLPHDEPETFWFGVPQPDPPT